MGWARLARLEARRGVVSGRLGGRWLERCGRASGLSDTRMVWMGWLAVLGLVIIRRTIVAWLFGVDAVFVPRCAFVACCTICAVDDASPIGRWIECDNEKAAVYVMTLETSAWTSTWIYHE